MANTRLGNTFYIDTQYAVAADELALKNILVSYVCVTATAAGGRVVLGDSSLGTKLDLRVATSGETQVFEFNADPILFSTSLRPTTLTNAVVTCVGRESRS